MLEDVLEVVLEGVIRRRFARGAAARVGAVLRGGAHAAGLSARGGRSLLGVGRAVGAASDGGDLLGVDLDLVAEELLLLGSLRDRGSRYARLQGLVCVCCTVTGMCGRLGSS